MAVKLSRAAQALADAGLVNPRLAKLAAKMDEFKQRNVPMGEPMDTAALMQMAEITPMVIESAKIDWRISMPPEAQNLLDAEEA